MELPSLFGADDGEFDASDAFVPDHLPDPGPFLAAADVLTGDDHVAFHRITRELFEERSVYDATFGYNLARLNRDARHPDAGYRYAAETERVLRAEFTPTTAFCPQSDTLCVGSFRAWNGLAERHEYDLVRVRVSPMHQRAPSINDRLRHLERQQDAFEATGIEVDSGDGSTTATAVPRGEQGVGDDPRPGGSPPPSPPF